MASKDKKTHILVVTQYFNPEPFRINDICLEWIKRGYRVTVLTGIPNYPEGKFYEGYGYTKKRHENWQGIEIIRIPLIPRGSGKLQLGLNYFSFVMSGYVWKMLTNIKADLVFNFEVSPMTQVKVGTWYAKKYRVPCVLYLQDIWPDNIVSVLGTLPAVLIKPIEKMVNKIYKDCDLILTTSQSFKKTLEERGVPAQKVRTWYQYAEEYEPGPLPKNVRDSFLEIEQDVLKVMYTGNVGTAQGLEILLDVAKLLEIHKEKVKFIIVGSGRYLAEMKASVTSTCLEHFFLFLDRVNANQVPSLLQFADFAYLGLKDSSIFAKTIPAKFQTYVAHGMPIIGSISGEVSNIIRREQIGYCSDAGDVNGLVRAIAEAKKNTTTEYNLLRIRSKQLSECLFNKEKLMDKIDSYFTYLIQEYNGESVNL